MKRLLIIIFSVLQLLIAAGLIVLHHLSETRMGVMRVLVYQAKTIENTLSIWFWVSVAVLLAALLVFSVMQAVRSKAITRARFVALSALSVTAIVAFLLFSRQTLHIYYYLLVGIGVTILLQAVKCLLSRK